VTPTGARVEYDLDLGQALSHTDRSVVLMLHLVSRSHLASSRRLHAGLDYATTP
jgi:hypothetical protein